MTQMRTLGVLIFWLTIASAMECPPGTYGESPRCEKCPAGTFNPFSGAPDLDVCRQCPTDTFQPERGAAECIPCPGGMHSQRGYKKCFTCGPGTELNWRRQGCKRCDRGYYSNMTANVACEECPTGMSSRKGADGIAKCFSCPPGQDFRDCSPCRPGRFKPGREGLCEFCPPGFSSEEGFTKCKPCPRGKFLFLGESRGNFRYHCRTCPPGTTSQKASDICRKAGEPCPPRHFENKNGSCQTCRAGHIFIPKDRTCKKCPPGSASRGGMQTECDVCPNGQRPDDLGQRVCRCQRGFYFDDEGKCVGCPLGHGSTYSNALPKSFLGRRGCVPCRLGTSSNKPGQVCEMCRYPLVAMKEGLPSCSPCPPGTTPAFRVYDDSESCVTLKTGCPLGQRNKYFWGSFCELVICAPNAPKADVGRTCTPCEAGQFLSMNSRGKPVCKDCPNDHFSAGGLTTICRKCANRKVRSTLDGSRCTCNGTGGKRFQVIVGRGIIGGECKPCPPGTFSFTNLYFQSNDESCTPCRPGTFAKKPGTEECEECPLNTFASELGASRCKPCPGGTVGHPHFGATSCVAQPKYA